MSDLPDISMERKTKLQGDHMSKQQKHTKLLDRLKAYYRSAERDAHETAPFYVTENGSLFANANELLHSKVVKRQLTAFASLDNDIKNEKKKKEAEA